MQKYFMALVVGLVAVLAGCQTNPPSYPNVVGHGLGPLFNPSQATINNLSQSVQEALYRTGDPVLAQVRVEATSNTVILSGYVKKIRQSDIAEQVAHQVPGVQSVVNNLIVRQ